MATDERGEIVPVSDEPSTSRGCRFWEATRWLPGQAMLVEESASWELLQYAVAALGKFHRLTADLHPRRGPIPGLLDRRHRLQQWQGGLCDEIERAIRQASAHPGNSVACAIFERIARYADGVERELAEAAVAEYSLQPCIRDVRPEHFLFVDQEVRGLVDFGALRIDHVAGDLARLLGSLWPRWQHDWRRAIDVYADEFRALGEEELQIMQLFDRSTTLVASINWLDWVFGQQRQFESLQQVTHRLQRWLERLQSWSSR